jgi:hypothetical protein
MGSPQNKHLPLEEGIPEIRPLKAEGRLFGEHPAPMVLPCIKHWQFLIFFKVLVESRVIREVPQLGSEDGQFWHNRESKRITGNESFTKTNN